MTLSHGTASIASEPTSQSDVSASVSEFAAVIHRLRQSDAPPLPTAHDWAIAFHIRCICRLRSTELQGCSPQRQPTRHPGFGIPRPGIR